MMLVFKTDLGSQFKTLGSSHRQSCSIHQKSSVGRVINDIIYIIRLTILDLAVSAADPWIVEHNIAKIRSGSKHHFFFRIQGKHLSLVLSCQYINSMAHRRFRRLFFFLSPGQTVPFSSLSVLPLFCQIPRLPVASVSWLLLLKEEW